MQRAYGIPRERRNAQNWDPRIPSNKFQHQKRGCAAVPRCCRSCTQPRGESEMMRAKSMLTEILRKERSARWRVTHHACKLMRYGILEFTVSPLRRATAWCFL